MKTTIKFSLLSLVALFLLNACQEKDENNNISKKSPSLQDLVGKVEQGPNVSIEEIEAITKAVPDARIGCILGGDTDCTEASDDVERFIKDCTLYPRELYPDGTTTIYYKGLSFYVDADGDINLDRYQDALQNHVDKIVDANKKKIHFIIGEVLDWPCSDREYNAGIIKYTVYNAK